MDMGIQVCSQMYLIEGGVRKMKWKKIKPVLQQQYYFNNIAINTGVKGAFSSLTYMYISNLSI